MKRSTQWLGKRMAPVAAVAMLVIITVACGSSSSGSSASTGAPATAAAPTSAGSATTGSPTSTAPAVGAPLRDEASCAANKAVGPITYVSPFGFDASAGIIDVFAAEKLGYFDNMCLNVKFVTNSQNSTALVSAGTAQVSNIGSAADLLGQAANGANVVGVATYGDTSVYTILAQKDITDLKQLEGKSLGYHFVVPVTILQILSAAGVDPSKVKMVNTTSFDPNQLFQGRFDAMEAYQSNEPITLKAAGKQFNQFDPDSLGVKGTFNVHLFNKDFVAKHPTIVADFMRAQLHAFDYCVKNPDECIQIEKEYASAAGADYDVDHARAVWDLESKLATTHSLPGKGVGVQSADEWTPEAQALAQYKIVPKVPALADVQNNTIVEGLYQGTQLIWPG
jgi:ABC-type nitrate/sulfonate/bicarbonate transport system substrate-binding protein